MDFLKGKFNEELLAEIEDNGNVKIAGSSFTPDSILKEMDSDGYNEAFSDWLDQRKKRLLIKADEILRLYDNQGRFNRLRDSYKRGAVIPFIGAGMSIPSGYPGWTKFLCQLRNETRVSEDDLNNLLSQGKYEEAVQALADDMPAGSFDEAIENAFGHDEDLAGTIQMLPYIFNTSIITTNFDDVIKRCYEAANLSFLEILLGANARELPRYLGEGSKVLIKLHGKANSRHSRVLTYTEYQRHYREGNCLLNVIEAISTKTLLFIGCSLVVDRTIQVLTQLVETKGHDVAIRHYALLSIGEDEDRLARRDHLAMANIFPIWYPADEDHDECIEALLWKLIGGG
ncbi:hypothetical protein ANME2D_00583 [Candidatus Methanoperedens nitroreducens]|uniref:Uncharacterized protein n=1 Tax=Candidatus Methanoperedens nitratireducens TaxID=1392998 RepID=A0A062VEA0_9EURY|nr:SIR2 family protein [Candidatus Methanoperedens nitroreducens]KCZ73515.1 hypothetical protein ANME2D_00583 [Candidatus Methanoperedens nitroreducens]MDJ1422529.1 SIR2 family protein [Candidatus Methanoperedens sp.]